MRKESLLSRMNKKIELVNSHPISAVGSSRPKRMGDTGMRTFSSNMAEAKFDDSNS
jgi:hypothetical protein